jgi:hypothetical protein
MESSLPGFISFHISEEDFEVSVKVFHPETQVNAVPVKLATV